VAAAQGTIFKRDWFRHYQQPPEKFSRIIQSWDTAFKTGATNDYSVCATFGETQNGFYLLALYRAKMEFPELKRQVAQQADSWRPSEILLEDKASGQSLIQELKPATNYPVIPVKIDRDKESRASAVTGYFEAGRILFPEGAPWLADLEDELASFPGGLHDDCVDAISQTLNYLRPGGLNYGVLELMKTGWDGFVESFRPRRNDNVEAQPVAKVATTLQGPPAEPPKQATERVCEKCGAKTWQTIGPQIRCAQCRRQEWAHGAPEIPRFNRRIFPVVALSFRFERRVNGRNDFGVSAAKSSIAFVAHASGDSTRLKTCGRMARSDAGSGYTMSLAGQCIRTAILDQWICKSLPSVREGGLDTIQLSRSLLS
jgi:predicted phage terminase large subunit-like protein